jgi:hypothetical protein
MAMTEIPLVAASFLAISAFPRFLASERRNDALAFAFWTFASIMIKGNGWLIVFTAPAILLLTGRLRLVRNRWLWISAFLVGLLCVPYTLTTIRIIAQGTDTQTFPGFAYELLSLGKHLGFMARLLGIPLTVMGCSARSCRFSGNGPHRGPGAIRSGWGSSFTASRSFSFTLRFTGFSLLTEYAPGFGAAVASLIARPEAMELPSLFHPIRSGPTAKRHQSPSGRRPAAMTAFTCLAGPNSSGTRSQRHPVSRNSSSISPPRAKS